MSDLATPPMLDTFAFGIPKSAIPTPFTAEDISFKSITFDPETRERTITLHFSRVPDGGGADDVMNGETIIVEYLGEKRGFDFALFKTGITLFGKRFNFAIPFACWIMKSRTTMYQKVDTHIRSGGNEYKKSKTWDRR
jgi:hypothetical protein